MYLSNLLSVCMVFGIVPDSFCEGILLPIIKKPTAAPATAKSYRPLILSIIFSKLLEYHILDLCIQSPSPSQFGFIPGRGTNMAISLVHDISAICNARGSTVFMCSLDAEGAYDGLPHVVLLQKSMNVIPDNCWTILYNWYHRIYVTVRLNNSHSSPIRIEKGIRQGGLTSPYLFNLVYKDFIEMLNSADCGITIDNTNITP